MKNNNVRYTRGGGSINRPRKKSGFPKGFLVLLLLLLSLAAFFTKVLSNEQDIAGANTGSGSSTTEQGNNNEENATEKVNSEQSGKEVKGETAKVYVVQCGVFKNEENAKKVGNQLSSIGEAFYTKSGELIRVNLGIYTEENASAIVQRIKSNNIEATKVPITMSANTVAEKEIVEIINANLKILNKAAEDKVEAVDTNSMKKWIDGLKKVPETDPSFENLKKITEFSKGLEEKVSKNKSAEYYEYIYNFIKDLGYIK